jgi:hypothetical protein
VNAQDGVGVDGATWVCLIATGKVETNWGAGAIEYGFITVINFRTGK